MPYADERLYWKVRLPRHLRARVEKQAKILGFPNVRILELAVDNWLGEQEKAQK